MVIPRAALLLAAAAALAAAAPAAHGDVVSLAVDGGPHGPGDVITVSGEVDGAGEHRLVTIQVEGPGNVIAHREMVEAGAGGRFSASFAAGEPKYRWGDGAYQVRADHAGGRAVEVFVYFAAPPVPGAELQAAPAAPPPAPEDAGGPGGSGPGPLDWLPSEGTWGLPALAVLALAIPAAALAIRSRRRGARAHGRAAAEGQAARAGAVPKQPEAPARAVPGQQEARPAAQAGAVPRPPAQEAPQKRAVPRQPAAQPRAAPQAAQAGAAPSPPEQAAAQAPAQAPAPAPPRPDIRPRMSRDDREALLRERIPDDGKRIVVDSNAYLDTMSPGDDGSGWDGRIGEGYLPRLAVPRTAIREAAGVLQNKARYDATRLPVGHGALADEPPDAVFLGRLEEVHGRAANDPDSPEAGCWLRSKAKFLAGMGYPGGAGLGGEGRRKALGILYERAADDREITAVAAAVAARDGKAYLVTSDGDMTEFVGEIRDISGGRLRVRRPEAAGARGRRREAEEGSRDGERDAPGRDAGERARRDVSKGTAAILLGSSIAFPLAAMLGGGGGARDKKARSLEALWGYVSAGGGAGRAGVTETVRGTVARGARRKKLEGLARLTEAAGLAVDAQNRQAYAGIVGEMFRDEGSVDTGAWARRKKSYLASKHGIRSAGDGGPYSRADGGAEVGEGEVRAALLEGASGGDVYTAAEAMCAAEEREVVLVTNDGNFEVIRAALLERILVMRAGGARINPVWIMDLRTFCRAIGDG